jgi:hypothetical protein
MRSILIALLMLSSVVKAEPAAVVEALQMPAWIERGDMRSPLQLGYALEGGDRIATGRDARVLLRLEEGSHIKLGENAQFDIAALSAPADRGGVFSGLVNVVRGAFRFTTSAIGAARKRDITARVSTVTIGIRGTDVWGKADVSRDFVVLIEGGIDIARDGEAATRMDTPLTIFSAPRQAASEPVRPVDRNDLGRWAAETELEPGGGIVSPEGRWAVVLLATGDDARAQALAARLQQAGYAADVVAGESVEMREVTVSGLRTGRDAERLRQRIAREFSLDETRVIEQRRRSL